MQAGVSWPEDLDAPISSRGYGNAPRNALCSLPHGSWELTHNLNGA